MNQQEWEKLRANANKMADDEYTSKASDIIRLTKSEITEIVKEADVDKDKLSELISIVNDATKSNEEKATAIKNITGLAEVVAPLIKTLL